MATAQRSVGRKLALISAFAVLLVAAFGVGCKGFFTGNTLNSISVQPATVNLEVNAQQQFTAFGTYSDNSRQQITSGLVWSSSDPSVTITSGGLATALTVSSSVTITGSAQGYTGTGTVSVIGNVTSMTVSPSSANIPENQTPGVAFTFTGSPGPPMYITPNDGGTLTVTPMTPVTSGTGITCTVGTDPNTGNPAEVCTADSGSVVGNPWTIQMSYPTPSGGTVTVSAQANATGT
jgi:hypothetical protein